LIPDIYGFDWIHEVINGIGLVWKYGAMSNCVVRFDSVHNWQRRQQCDASLHSSWTELRAECAAVRVAYDQQQSHRQQEGQVPCRREHRNPEDLQREV